MKRTSRIQTVISPLHRKKLDSLTLRYGTMNEVIERGIELLEQLESETAITESDEEILELKRRAEVFDALSSFSGFVLINNKMVDTLLEVLGQGLSVSDYLKKQQKWVLEDLEIQKIVTNLGKSIKNSYESLIEVVRQISDTFRTFHVLVASESEKKILIQPNLLPNLLPELVGVQLQGILDFLGFTFGWRITNERIIIEWSERPEKHAEINVDSRLGTIKGLKGVLEKFAKDKSISEGDIIKELMDVALLLEIPNWHKGFFTSGNRRYSFLPQDILVELFDKVAQEENANDALQIIGKDLLNIRVNTLDEIRAKHESSTDQLPLILETIKILFANVFGWGSIEIVDDKVIKLSEAIINCSILQEIMNGMLASAGFQVVNISSESGTNSCEFSINTSRVRILIVDDEKRVLQSLAKTLEREEKLDYEILKTETGEEALEMIHKFPIELILCDHKMPGMTGTELLEKIRLVDPSIVRILITGYSEVDIARDAVNKAKIHYFIEKPPDPDELRRIVYEEVTKRRQNG
ncbi:MAG: Hydrogenase transcriptional regulatory protein hupR1 [Candidatus Heimdallarchaeota archaeon LC_3]|nr:MAG: Hydrogenase transcriptional regulatory protein hupR1 [Candidatus Heimdallarchaeota archaeon LC_3]